jgi:hypothetical protein
MKRKRFTEEQIIGILKEAEAGAKSTDLCRRHAISEQTFYRWKAKYAGLEVNEARTSVRPYLRPGHTTRILECALQSRGPVEVVTAYRRQRLLSVLRGFAPPNARNGCHLPLLRNITGRHSARRPR